MLGEKIRELRKGKGLTIKDLAKLSGITEPTITNIELGKHKPRLPVLQKLCVALDCDFDELYDLWN